MAIAMESGLRSGLPRATRELQHPALLAGAAKCMTHSRHR